MNYHKKRLLSWCLLAASVLSMGLATPELYSAEEASNPVIAELDKALQETKDGSSEARQRLAVRRVIRDAEKLLETHKDKPSRFEVLEFLFRAQQELIALDKDPKHRQALLETSRELVKAPDELAELRLEADLLLSQAELAKNGANAEERAKALRPFVDRYIDTPVGAKVLRLSMVMALELGDNQLVTDLREMISENFAADYDMISFQRDKLGGQVFGAPFAGVFKRSDGKNVLFPMDALGRSSMLVFWSKDEMKNIKALAEAALENKENLNGRLELISFNLDELPDAGESLIREMGVDWQVIHLPGGRENPVYKAYVRTDPRRLTLSPTGQTALIMEGTSRRKVTPEGTPDYGRMFGSALARSWTQPNFVMHLSSVMAGDFLILDVEGDIDPTRPPELKAAAKGQTVKPLVRGSGSIPEETLEEIQSSFVKPPLRYRLSHQEARASYAKAEQLCRKAIAEYPNAPDLWIVRNRLIIALMGLWKTESDLSKLEAAISEAKAALEAGYPPGCDTVARFCIAREELRNPTGMSSREIIDKLVDNGGGESASGPVYAVAALLALDVADRAYYEKYCDLILKGHTEYPMMWIFSGFILDRNNDYWMFQVPFTAGWSYGRRESYFQTIGNPEDANRILKAELQKADGTPFRIPEDLDTKWTVIFFAAPEPWNSKRDDGLPPNPQRVVDPVASFAESRPDGDVKVALATLGGEPASVFKDRHGKETACTMMTVPEGLDNPIVHRLGILAENKGINSVLIGKDGRIIVSVSGMGSQSSRSGNTLINAITHQDEKFVTETLDSGDIEKAKNFILQIAPPYDPEAVDDRGRKLKVPKYNLGHLRARARVYMALNELDKALADAEEVVQRQLGTDGGMSLRTDELDESEALRETILQKIEAEKAER